MRILAFFFLSVFFVLNIVFGVLNGNKATKATRELDGERYGRMVAEEGLEAAKVRIDSLKMESKRQGNKIKSIERLLKQTIAGNKDLKSRAAQMKEKKVMLETRIKELEQIIVQKVPSNATSGM